MQQPSHPSITSSRRFLAYTPVILAKWRVNISPTNAVRVVPYLFQIRLAIVLRGVMIYYVGRIIISAESSLRASLSFSFVFI